MPSSFSPQERLRKSRDFALVQKLAQKLYCKHFLILIAPGKTLRSRLGITVTIKIDKRAVVRNLIKRRIRALYRTHKKNLLDVFDIVIIARKNAGEISFNDMKREILGSLKHNGYLKSKSL
jgi:ribonuclease P protein component